MTEQDAEALHDLIDDKLMNDINLTELDLSGKVQEFSEDIVMKLHEFESLKKLDLSNNPFNELPVNMDLLDTVQELNLIDVDFDDLYEVYAALQSMPELKILNLNLENSEEVDDTLKALPDLKILNGISESEAVVSPPKEETKVQVEKEQVSVTSTPAGSMMGLKVAQAMKDILEMSITEYEEQTEDNKEAIQEEMSPERVIPKELKMLEELGTSFEEQTEQLKAQLINEFSDKTEENNNAAVNISAQNITQPSIEVHNFNEDPNEELTFQQIKAERQKQEKVQTVGRITPEKIVNELLISENGTKLDVNTGVRVELYEMASIYEKIGNIRKRMPGHSDEEMNQDFQYNLTNMFEAAVLEIGDSKDLDNKDLVTIKGKQYILGVLAEKAMEYLEVAAGETDAASIIGEILNMLDIQIEAIGEIVTKVKAKKAKGSPSPLKQRPSAVNPPLQGIIRPQDAGIIKNLEDENACQADEIKRLKMQIKQLNQTNLKKTQENRNLMADLKAFKSVEKAGNKSPNIDQVNSTPAKRRQGDLAASQPEQTKPLGGQIKSRVIPLNKLKEIINDIYAQKLKFDKKCSDAKVPRETMEQYMYTYLNQKYGLKSLTVEWAASIINGIKNNVQVEHEVKLFAKILKNECDEEFRLIQMHVKNTLVELVTVLIKDKYPRRSKTDVTKTVQAIQDGTIDDSMWLRILDKMYKEEDSHELSERVRTAIDKRAEERYLNQSRTNSTINTNTNASIRSASPVKGQSALKKYMNVKASRDELTKAEETEIKQQDRLLYSDFNKIVLDFQLQEHERFICSFVSLFKSIDLDRDGIINEEQFRQMLYQMNVLERPQHPGEQDAMLKIIDPHNNKKMTFSEVVNLFLNHLVPMPNGQNIPLLEKFINNCGDQNTLNLDMTDREMAGEQEEDDEEMENPYRSDGE